MTDWIPAPSKAAPDIGGPVDRAFDPVTAEDRTRPLWNLVCRRTETQGEGARFTMADGVWTGRALLDWAEALARPLERHDDAGKASIACLAPLVSTQIVTGLACLSLGLPYLPLDPDHAAVHYRGILVRPGARMVVAYESATADLDSLTEEIARHIDRGETAPAAAGNGHRGTDNDAALILFTSGATGTPKGVVRSQASLRATILCRMKALNEAKGKGVNVN